jgi:hypothetical protein
MQAISACPEDHELRRFLLGQVAEADIDGLQRHLAQCPRCRARAEALPAQDTLVQTLSTVAAQVRHPDDPAVNDLIVRLQRLQRESRAAAPETTSDGSAEPDADDDVALFRILAPAQAPGELGRLGSYRVLSIIGRGGMGVVFRVEDVQLGRPVALKVMRPSRAITAAARQRFLREARAAATVKHPHIVTIYQVGDDQGTPFLAMELLDGESLEARLKRLGRLSPAEVLELGRALAAGLAAAHERGVIHRDIKPANVFLEGVGHGESGTGDSPLPRVKILDFGLARTASEDLRLTESGVIVGTPEYMAPEQARGRPVDARCDLFSLGSVLYHAATGVVPFRGADAVSTLLAVADGTPAPPRQLQPRVPPALSELVMWLLQKDPAARPASARAVLERLRAIDAPRPAAAVAVSATDLLPAVGEGNSADPPEATTYTGQARGANWKAWVLASFVAPLVLLPLGLFLRPAWLPFGAHEPDPLDPGVPPVAGPPPVGVGGARAEEVHQAAVANPPPVGADRDRQAAEWVLSLGGNAGIRDGNGFRQVQAPGTLPADAFVLEFVNLHSKPATSAGLARLKGLTNLKVLLVGASRITDDGLEHLAGLVSLGRLSLNSTSVSDDGLKHLQGLTAIANLDLQYTQVRGAGLKYLKDFRDLQTLSLSNSPITDAGLESIKEFDHLRELSLGGRMPLTDAALGKLQGLPNLLILRLQAAEWLTDAGLKALKNRDTLNELNLAQTQISDAGLEHLQGFANLNVLVLSQTQVRGPGLGYLKHLPELVRLDLFDTQVDDAGLQALQDCRSLQSLNLAKTRVTAQGIADLQKALPKCRILRV